METKWTPFEKCEYLQGPDGKAYHVSEHPEKMLGLGTEEVYLNSRYQVFVYRGKQVPQNPEFYQMIWLSIKRLDKQPIHDWRDMQRIKNELIGEENEAMELYPAESRLVDTSNQYHLWVIEDPKVRFPLGWTKRLVGGTEVAKQFGAVQRDHEN